jgi:unspecific monooxygenase
MYHLHQSPTDPAFVQNPYAAYDAARTHGSVVYWADYDMPVALSPGAVNAVLRDRSMGRVPVGGHAPFASHLADFAALEAGSMLELEPPTHTRLRGLVLRAFTQRRIAALAPEIEALCHTLIDAIPRTGPFDLLTTYAQKVPVIVIARLIGMNESMADQLLAWSHAMVAMYQAGRTHDDEVRANTAARDFAACLHDVIAQRRACPADDLLSHLIAAEASGARLTTQEMIATCVLLLNAGHEATVHTLGNGVKAILENGIGPEALTPDRAPETVEEILRYDPPLHLFVRHVQSQTTIMGHWLAPGSKIGCLLGAAGRDPAVFDDPHAFRPNRPGPGHAAFGAGIHFCLGAPLARLELAIALRVLFQRLPDLHLAAPPRYAPIYHFHGLERLEVAF